MNAKASKSNTNCCVPQCHSTSEKNPELSFHKFPSETEPMFFMTNSRGMKVKTQRRKEWLLRFKIGKKVTDRMVVCSKHFKDEDFSTGVTCKGKPRTYYRLRPLAVPSLYLPSWDSQANNKTAVEYKGYYDATKRDTEMKSKCQELKPHTRISVKEIIAIMNKPEPIISSTTEIKNTETVEMEETTEISPLSYINLEVQNSNNFKTKEATKMQPIQHEISSLFYITNNPEVQNSNNVNVNEATEITPVQHEALPGSNIINNDSEAQKFQNVKIKEETECQTANEASARELTSDSNSIMNEKLSENASYVTDFSCKEYNSKEFLKRELEDATANYKKAQKKVKLFEKKCKLYKKQMTSLKVVLNNLEQICSISDDL